MKKGLFNRIRSNTYSEMKAKGLKKVKINDEEIAQILLAIAPFDNLKIRLEDSDCEGILNVQNNECGTTELIYHISKDKITEWDNTDFIKIYVYFTYFKLIGCSKDEIYKLMDELTRKRQPEIVRWVKTVVEETNFMGVGVKK